MSSLQDQLLKAGLVSKDKATKTKSAKRKQAKINRKHKLKTIDEAKVAAEKTMLKQAERDRLLNQEKNAKADEIAILAQIKQLIEVNQQATGKPQITFNFSDQGIIKKLELSNEIHRHLTNGLLNIARLNNSYSLVPKVIAEKIQQRSNEHIVPLNLETELVAEDDPYADYQIPDDLMW
ncbi:MAG: DUF2058 domain-containing protein [Kangiellaceae bacterium]|nr:DUF2058 domain-containing protein [Kangiellaceae bacterium]